jgi:peptide/nickel transport system permease protein
MSAVVPSPPAVQTPGDAAVPQAAAAAAGQVRFAVVRAAWKLRRTRIGAIITGAVVALALIGPLVAPYSPTAFVGHPFAATSGSHPLGTDYLGRDALSRVMHGGVTILVLSLIATVIGVGLGTIMGLTAGYLRGWRDTVIMRASDVLLCIPAIVMALLLMSILGTKAWLLVVAVVLVHAPQTARVMRGAASQMTGREFVSYTEALGVSRTRIVLREILPNVTAPLTVEFGLRMTYSIAIVASLGFLGFGRQPPAADWGLMINENRVGLTIQPWPVLAPVILLALLTVGNNLMTDGLARAMAGIDRVVDTGADG